MDELVDLVALALAHSATNLDNLALLLVVSKTFGTARASVAYASSQVLMLSTALLFSWGYSAAIGAWAGYLGLVPIFLGCYALLRGRTPAKEQKSQGNAPFILTTLTFTGLSFDTLAVFAPILADGIALRDYTALAGALLSATIISLVPVAFGRFTSVWLRLTGKLEKIAPFVIIAAGLYVLLDTSNDLS